MPLYAAKVHLFAGEPEGGKGSARCLQRRGSGVRPASTSSTSTSRTRPRPPFIGWWHSEWAADAIAKGFHYVRPDEPLDNAGRAAVERVLEAYPADLAIIDGLTDKLAIRGIETRDNAEVANWMRDLPQGLRRRGIATVLDDHVVKDSDAHGRYSIGAQQKLAKVDVASA